MNKEITIIDLLNKIANGEEVPKKIKYNGNDYYFCKPCKIYEIVETSELCGKDLYNLLDDLNDKVEIIEEDNKIEKLDEYIYCDSLNYNTCNMMFENIVNKINELIDEVNKLKEDK